MAPKPALRKKKSSIENMMRKLRRKRHVSFASSNENAQQDGSGSKDPIGRLIRDLEALNVGAVGGARLRRRARRGTPKGGLWLKKKKIKATRSRRKSASRTVRKRNGSRSSSKRL